MAKGQQRYPSTSFLGSRPKESDIRASLRGAPKVYAPRYTHAARLLAWRAMQALAAADQIPAREFLRRAITMQSTWDLLAAWLLENGTKITARAALQVLTFHRDAHVGVDELSEAHLRAIMRPIYKNGAISAPEPESIGLEPTEPAAPQSFEQWLAPKEDEHLRVPSSQPRPTALLDSLGCERLPPDGKEHVVMPVRAQRIITEWRRTGKKAQGALPPLRLLRAVLNTDVLPTIVGNPADRPFLIERNRFAGIDELGPAFGLRQEDPLLRILANGDIISDRQAIQALGKSLSIEAVVALLKAEDVRKPLPSRLRIAAAFAGIGMTLVAVGRAFPKAAFSVSFISEIQKPLRTVLLAAFSCQGLSQGRCVADATSEEAIRAPRVEIFFLTADCKAHSPNNNTRSEREFVESMRTTAAALRYVHTRRPLLVVIENVHCPILYDGMVGLLEEIPGYVRRYQCIDMHVLCEDPMRRKRGFWTLRRTPE